MSKIINTRIGLKYDSYQNWAQVEQTFVPLRGEVIFYEFPSNNMGSSAEPAILFKIGDGSKTLGALTWGQAIAADVWAWAKKQSLLGGTWTEQGGWDFSNTSDETINRSRNEVSAYVIQQNANYIKTKMDEVTEENYQQIYGEPYNPNDGVCVNRKGKYQISVSTDGGTTWTATGEAIGLGVKVKKLEAAQDGYAASYVVEQGGVQKGDIINIPKDYLVKSADLKTVEVEDEPYEGAHVGDKYIDFVINTKETEPMYFTQQNYNSWLQGHNFVPAFQVGDPALRIPDNTITYNIIKDQASYEAALADPDSGLSIYYRVNPSEDLQKNGGGTVGFNDRRWSGTISGEEGTKTFAATWKEKSQMITNVNDSSEVYYMRRLDPASPYYGTDEEWRAQYTDNQFIGNSWVLYTNEQLTEVAEGKEFFITGLTFDGCSHTYAAWSGNTDKMWLVINLPTPGTAILDVQYDGTDYYPWGENVRIFSGGYAICNLPAELGMSYSDIDTSLISVINSQTVTNDEHIYLPVNDLVDIYEGSEYIDITNNVITAKNTSLLNAKLEECTFNSYGDSAGTIVYSTGGKVNVISKDTANNTTTVKVISNPGFPEWIGGIYTVPTTEIEENVLYRLSQGGTSIDVWVKITDDVEASGDGVATVLDVKAYVDSQVGGSSANVVAGDGINITDAASTKIVSVNLDETTQTPGLSQNSGLAVGPDGLRINDEIVWEFHCGSSTENI